MPFAVSTADFAIESPRPVPATSAGADWARKNRSKMRSCAAAGMPGPRSMTSTMACSGVSATRTMIALRRGRELDRVVHQVDERLPHHQAVAQRARRAVRLDDELLRLLLREHRQIANHAVGQILQRDRFDRQLRLAGFRAREREQAIDEARQPIDLLEHAADDGAILSSSRRLPRRPTSPTLRMAVSGVRSSCETSRGEAAHLVERLLRGAPSVALNTVASRPISLSGLLTGSRSLNRSAVIVSRALGHPLDGRERAARQHVAAKAGGRHGERQAEHESINATVRI